MSPLSGESVQVQLYEGEHKMKSDKIVYTDNARVWDKHDSLLESKNTVENLKTQHCFHADCFHTEFNNSASQKQEYEQSSSKMQDKNGGARPKMTSVHGNKKSVRWAEDLTATVEVQKLNIEDEEMKQCSNLINCLREQKTFFKSPAFEAVSWMYEGNENMTVKSELVYILLRLRHHREPSAQDMMEILEGEPEMDKQDFIGAIVDECQRQGGAPVMESFLLEQKISEKQFNNVEDSVVTKTVEIPNLTKEEQIQRLKVEALKIEQTFLKNSLTCRQCKERPVNTIFLPCGHVVLCSECSESCYTCPLCKKQVLGEVKTYLC